MAERGTIHCARRILSHVTSNQAVCIRVAFIRVGNFHREENLELTNEQKVIENNICGTAREPCNLSALVFPHVVLSHGFTGAFCSLRVVSSLFSRDFGSQSFLGSGQKF